MGEENVVYMKATGAVTLDIEEADGDLVVEVGSAEEVRAFGEDVHLDTGDGQRFTLRSESDCRVRVPENAQVTIRAVSGDLRVQGFRGSLSIQDAESDVILRDIDGPVTIDSIGSDARLTDINGPVEVGSVESDLVVRDINGPVTIETVGSDLETKRINGPLRVESVGSDIKIKEIRGPISIDSVGSDAVISEASGPLSIGAIGSDLVLDTPFEPGAHHDFASVGGDVLIKIRPDDRVRLVVPHDVERAIDVRNVRAEKGSDQDVLIVGEAGEGAASVEIGSISGELQIARQARGFSASFEFAIPDNLGEIISTRISEQLGRIQEGLQREAERLEREARRARDRAEEAAERARQRAEREKGKFKGPRGSRTWSWTWGGGMPRPPEPPNPPPRPPAPPAQPVTEQERLAILKMVENKTISIEEAERLLAALEGRG